MEMHTEKILKVYQMLFMYWIELDQRRSSKYIAEK
jgi:hypothetical protein